MAQSVEESREMDNEGGNTGQLHINAVFSLKGNLTKVSNTLPIAFKLQNLIEDHCVDHWNVFVG